MSINEFLNLEIEEQVEWLNGKRATMQLKEIEAELGAKAYVIEKPIKHAGYKYDHNLKRYVLQKANDALVENETLKYIEQHLATIKEMIQREEERGNLNMMTIDKLI